MFQVIYGMYHKIYNKEASNAATIIINMSDNIQSNKQNYIVEDSRDKAKNNKPLLQKMNTPSDINRIQPRHNQVCNCDEIGFDPNRNWNKVIYTYKFSQVN